MTRRNRTSTLPSYRRHKASGLAVVTINSRDVYLGHWNSEESRNKYERVIAEWIATRHAATTKDRESLTVDRLWSAFLRHAEVHYRKDGRPTSELALFHHAMRPVRRLYGQALARDFGPMSLKTCRNEFVRADLSRKVINGHVRRVRQVFRWAVESELVGVEVYEALRTVPGLKKGRSEARETSPVEPVPQEHIDSILGFVSPHIAAMIQLQLLTGMRPGEVLMMRTCDLDTSDEAWTYTPHSHKTEHHQRERKIFIGPQAQRVVGPFLKTDLLAYLFSPKEAAEYRRTQWARKTKTHHRPSRGRKSHPKRAPRDRYDTDSYRQAIQRACDRAEVPRWSPNRLRHNAATMLRKRYGIEMTRVVLGHSSAVTSEIYAEADLDKAARIMSEVG